MISITVETRRASVSEKELLTTSSSGIQVQFTFSEDWDDLARVAVFKYGEEGTAYPIILDSSNLTEIPAICLTEDGEPLFVGAYGTDGNAHVIIPTIWVSVGVVRPGTGDAIEQEMPDEPESYWAQVLGLANAANDTANDALDIAGEANATATNALTQVSTALDETAGNRAAAQEARDAAEAARNDAIDYATLAKSWADGNTGAREGEETDNAKYWSEQAQAAIDGAIGDIEDARDAAIADVQGEGTTQIGLVGDEGTTQIGLVGAEGTAQIAAVQDEGAAQQALLQPYVTEASGYASDASGYATAANNSKVAAVAAQGAAETAQGKAEDAQTAAETAQGKAEDAQDAAEIAQGKAEDAQAAAEAAAASLVLDTTLTESGQAAEAAATGTALAGKVDKVNGKGLSTEDYTTAEKTKLSGIEAGAQVNTVTSVATKTGAVTLDAGDIAYDTVEVYNTGTVGRVISGLEVATGNLEDGLDDLTDEVSALKIVDTATGAIASFPDGADGLAVKSLVCEINPVQDLHSYDNPWPGGGAGNLLDFANPSTISKCTVTDSGNGVFTVVATGGSAYMLYEIPVTPGETYCIFCKAGSGLTRITTAYVHDGSGTSGTALVDGLTVTAARIFVPTQSVVTVSWRSSTSSQTGTGTVTEPIVCKGSTPPETWKPYKNLCPISGWTGCEMNRDGENLLQLNGTGKTEREVTWTINTTTGEVSASGTATGGNTTLLGSTIMLPPGQYTYSSGITETNGSKDSYIQNSQGTVIARGNSASPGSTFTLTEMSEIKVYFRLANGQSNTIYTPMIRFADESGGTFEPYQGDTVSIDWTDEAGTVYGGTLNVTTGVLTAAMAEVDLDTLTFTINGSSGHERYVSSVLSPAAKPASGSIVANALCSILKVSNSNAVYLHSLDNIICVDGDGKLQVYASQYMSENAFASLIDDQTVAYELATPITYQLDPVTVTTLLGQNNIWSDCGDVSVDYPCDTKLYIDKKLAALVAALS